MLKRLKIKVCGMRECDNINQLQQLPIDYMGLIFYPKSKRFVDQSFNDLGLKDTPKHLKLTGVFVNAAIESVVQIADRYQLNAIQLHGDETPIYCQEIKNLLPNVELIKAFGVREGFDFNQLQDFHSVVKFFLFDTQTSDYGGSGRLFNWQILDTYAYEIPFFLSGGIGIDFINNLKNFNHPKWIGIDLNSRFELKPGLKNIALVSQFLEELK